MNEKVEFLLEQETRMKKPERVHAADTKAIFFFFQKWDWGIMVRGQHWTSNDKKWTWEHPRNLHQVCLSSGDLLNALTRKHSLADAHKYARFAVLFGFCDKKTNKMTPEARWVHQGHMYRYVGDQWLPYRSATFTKTDSNAEMQPSGQVVSWQGTSKEHMLSQQNWELI